MNSKVYQSGLKFMLLNTVKRLYNGDVIFHHSLDKGIYATIVSSVTIDQNEMSKIKNHMISMVNSNIPFNKKVVSKQEAYNFYLNKGYDEKADNVLNISNLTVSMYEFEGQYNYFYSHNMPASTKEVPLFDIYFIRNNELVLIYPTNGEIQFTFRNKVYGCFHEYDAWLNRLNINYVRDVNKIVAEGHIKDLIKKNDIKVDQDLYQIAKDIIINNKRIALIAGPSSSGKTTTSKKLSLYLSSLGYNAMPLSLDDFFRNRDETPLDEFGQKDYECLEALDLSLFNNTLNELLSGRPVKLPRYNFIAGMKEFDETDTVLKENDILVIEGLHALNPNLIQNQDLSLYYKIYISPLTPLNVDRHNYISTTDNRLIRRIVRDFRTRGRSAEASLATWDSVRRGEEKYIFPYTDTCDAILNTAYAYEIGVLKVYIEPLLYSIKMDSKFYGEARRLLDNLKTFYSIPSEFVSHENLLREFIGGSVFEEEK